MKWWPTFAGLLVLSGAVYFSWPSDNGTHLEGPAAETDEDLERRDTIAPETPNSSSLTSLALDSPNRSADAEPSLPTRKPELADEQTIASSEKGVRERAVRETRHAYRLLFDDLRLTDDEARELFAYLVDVMVAGVWTRYRNGVKINDEERTNVIRTIIGDAKTRELLDLEANLASYHETSRIEALLGRSEAALTADQRDRLFEVLVVTRAALVDEADLATVEAHLSWMDERERRVMELTPSFLTQQQVVYLDREYQRCSQQRVAFLERRSRRESQNPGVELPAMYPLCSF